MQIKKLCKSCKNYVNICSDVYICDYMEKHDGKSRVFENGKIVIPTGYCDKYEIRKRGRHGSKRKQDICS